MSFVVSYNANGPSGYSPPTGHDTEALGSLEFYHRLRRFITGNPEIATLSKVGTHDTEIDQLDTHDNVALTTGTYSLRMNVGGTTMTLSHSTAGTLDAAVPAPASALTEYNFDRSQSHGIAFRIDRTVDADPASTSEGWDFTFTSNGLAAADRWFLEDYARAFCVVRGRRVSGSSDPADYFYIRIGVNEATGRWQVVARGQESADGLTGSNSNFLMTPLTETGAIAYWIVASHRHIAWVARISGDYHQQWVGFMDTFGTKEQYPYPLLIAGDSNDYATGASSTSNTHMAFPLNGDGATEYRTPEGTWKQCGATGIQSGTGFSTSDLGLFPTSTTAGYWPYHCPYENPEAEQYSNASERAVGVGAYLSGSTILTPLRGPTSGERYAIPIMVIQGEVGRHVLLGELASVFCTNGYGDPAPVEEVFEIASVSYVMFPNIQRQQEANFWSLKLE